MYDVVLLPEKSLNIFAIEDSRKLEKMGTYFTLKDGEFFPHLSLYMLQLRDNDLPRAQNILLQVSKGFPGLYLEARHYVYNKKFIDVEYGKTSELVNLQDIIISALNPIRDGINAKDIERMRKAEGQALLNFQDYGYKYVHELFRPHVTLTRLKNENQDALDMLKSPKRYSGHFTTLALFEMGDQDTCIRNIALDSNTY